MELDWIKALPGGEETDFVLISRDATSITQEGNTDTEAMQLKKACPDTPPLLFPGCCRSFPVFSHPDADPDNRLNVACCRFWSTR